MTDQPDHGDGFEDADTVARTIRVAQEFVLGRFVAHAVMQITGPNEHDGRAAAAVLLSNAVPHGPPTAAFLRHIADDIEHRARTAAT